MREFADESWRPALAGVTMRVETELLAGVEDLPVAAQRKDGAQALAGLKAALENCRRCEIGRTRTNLVFGTGNVKADLMFIGEAPGADEDRQGLPFVGRAGQLLTRMIQAMGLTREDVYIANVLKCRPPGNRDPQPHEIANCAGNLLEQVRAIGPRVICLLGRHAVQVILGITEPLGRIHGRFYDWHGIPAMPTFHPAYLLRSPSDKKLAWEDLKKIMAVLGQKGENYALDTARQ